MSNGNDRQLQTKTNTDLFSSLSPWTASSSDQEDGASLFASVNVFSNDSQWGTWMPFEVFGNGEDADGAQRTADPKDRGEVGADDRTTAEGKDFNMFQVMNIFEEAKDEDEDAWVDMAASMDEHLRKRSTGMDVRLMQDDVLEELFSKIARRLQQAKESSQAHSGQADGDYVLRTVTVWEINFWEGCEMSKATTGALDHDFICEHLDQNHDRDLLDYPHHWQSEETPLGCLLLGVPFRAVTHRARGPPSSVATSRVSDGIATLLDPASNMVAARTESAIAKEPNILEDLAPKERLTAVMKGTISVEDKLKFSQTFARTHCDWIAVKEHFHSKDPVVVSNYNGRNIRQSDLKGYSAREIQAIMRWRSAEVIQRKRMVFHCVGKPLPDMYQRCIHRLPHDAQDIIAEKLGQVRRHGSTALDLQEAARIIVENGGGYSAAVELKYDMDEPDHLQSAPTPSQAVEIQRTTMMRDMREGIIDGQEVLDAMYSTIGSRRGMSVTGGLSKLDTPGYKALVTPRENVDLYKARYLGNDAESLYSSVASRPSGAEHVEERSVASYKVQDAAERAHTKIEGGMPYVNVFKHTAMATDKALINRAPKRGPKR